MKLESGLLAVEILCRNSKGPKWLKEKVWTVAREVHGHDKVLKAAIKHEPCIASAFNGADKAECVDVIKRNPFAIHYLEDSLGEHTEELQLEFIRLYPALFEHLESPTEKVCEEAFQFDPENLWKIKKPTAEMWKRYLDFNPSAAFQYPSDRNPVLQSMLHNDDILNFIVSLLEKYFDDNCGKKGIVGEWDFERNREQFARKVMISRTLLDYLTGDSLESIIVKKPEILLLVGQQSRELCEKAIRLNPAAIRYFNKQTPKLCYMALSEDVNVAEYLRVWDMSYEPILYPDGKNTLDVLKVCPRAVYYVPPVSSKPIDKYIVDKAGKDRALLLHLYRSIGEENLLRVVEETWITDFHEQLAVVMRNPDCISNCVCDSFELKAVASAAKGDYFQNEETAPYIEGAIFAHNILEEDGCQPVSVAQQIAARLPKSDVEATPGQIKAVSEELGGQSTLSMLSRSSKTLNDLSDMKLW